MKITGHRPNTPITLKLELSAQEAMALRGVFSAIAGRAMGPRGMMDSIDDFLEALGVPEFTLPDTSEMLTMPSTWVKVVADDDEDA